MPTPIPMPSPRGSASARPSRSRRIRPALLQAVLLLACLGPWLAVPTAFAASITAVIDRNVIGLGESATLQVTLEGASEATPRIPAVAGVEIRQTSSQRQFSFVNGIQSSHLLLGYSITPSRIGDFSIGPVSVRAGNQTLNAPATRLRCVPANDPAAARNDGMDNAAIVELHLPRDEVFVGERFIAEAHLLAIGGNLRQAPQFQVDGFTLGQMQPAPTENNIRTNNRIYSRVRFLQPLTAARSGDLQIQASGCIIDIPLSRRAATDIFDEVFGGREARRFNLGAGPINVRVLPLPREGQPAGFNGAVGEFDTFLSASPTRIAAGDPITVRIQIRGRGNFDAVQLPDQPAWKGFRAYPPNATFEPSEPTGTMGVKTFEQVLTPESTDLTELPPFEFSFFVPETRTYRTIRTTAIPIQVAAGATTPSLPATPNDTTGAGTPTQPKVPPLKPHLGEPILASTLARPWLDQPWFIGAYLLPALAWCGLRILRRQQSRRSANTSARQRERLLKRVADGLRTLDRQRSEGDPAAFHATLFRVLQDAVAASTGQPPASITEGTLDTAFPTGSIPEETLAALHALFQACNQARYARQATPADLQELHAQADLATRKLAELPTGTRASP